MITLNQKIISKKEIICKTIFSQALGLMFRKKQNLIMVFPKERKVNLHTFFVFYPLDILVLNQHQRIVEIKHNFLPFTFWQSQQKGKYILELAFPSNYQISDKLDLKSREIRRECLTPP